MFKSILDCFSKRKKTNKKIKKKLKILIYMN